MQERAVNIIIKGLKDYGDCEITKILTHDFLRDKLKWTGKIRQANRIGRSMGMGKNRHVRVTFSNIEDKSAILKNRGLLKDTQIYLNKDLTII